MKKSALTSRPLLQELNQTVGLQPSFPFAPVSELLQDKAISVETSQAVRSSSAARGSSDISSSEGKDHSSLFLFVQSSFSKIIVRTVVGSLGLIVHLAVKICSQNQVSSNPC